MHEPEDELAHYELGDDLARFLKDPWAVATLVMGTLAILIVTYPNAA